ncbi:DEAD/DEAH box helicase [Tuwongella immobilis]|uniref:Uncharacterized protein n=1 Tax=Tuwongella immobilis TaxID=692036 RepID=A0A6C2YT05_9BACT|nr:DEAD/DEAH box helicase [Tuwongella immobilis]VIP04524.1 dead deah box helicase : DEAD/DEAH box helicase domain protein OS=Pirellula staleyi (strain ATCC 27377 / DSM 6068 / ICPB 4128) GN=Psta_1620 PE=3 SV=1: DEAD: Helicase_C [Tuwongella immobilis]VTS06409.1 dead deah box helicase : DEAD/DEAH box helicase domain protein OS=Pirellula staleyi (strain ATCC 27377 / DSM 6068 / ICPB 4128) GN=Psta_1620 PE=3 SV=1: DEAD: Helicase_C [Tuwongella immobilis]
MSDEKSLEPEASLPPEPLPAGTTPPGEVVPENPVLESTSEPALESAADELASEPSAPETVEYASLPLHPELHASIARLGYVKATPIQSAVIPVALQGKDVIGQAQTGTGKTAAFLIPFLNRWREDVHPGPQAIILAPTRELVAQVAEEGKKLAPSPKCKIVPIYGGAGMRSQVDALRAGCAVVVGSPGRVLDHLSRGTLKLDQVWYAVLDEADRMLDIGFRPDIEKILRKCPSDRQTLLMSATMSATVLRLVHRYMVEPTHLSMTPTTLTVDRIRQSFFTVDESRKFELLVRVILRERPRQCIIFCQRKKSSDRLHRDLSRIFESVAVMHGDLAQSQRERIMKRFRTRHIRCLIATDVVSRGIDVSGISHIFNYDLPDDLENYVHRIGRTGRMGKDGIAISFVRPDQGKQLTSIEASINRLISEDRIPGYVAFDRPPDAPAPASPPPPPAPRFGGRGRRYSKRI